MKRGTGLNPISASRLKTFGGRTPYNSLEKPGAPKSMLKAKRWTDTGPDDTTVEAVRKRDRYRCVCCGDPCPGRRGMEWSISHRKLRAQGVDNGMANLMLSCGNGSWGCESEIHRGPERARQAGWMLRSTEDPEVIPMEHAAHGTVLLLNDGTFAVIQAIREENDEHPF